MRFCALLLAFSFALPLAAAEKPYLVVLDFASDFDEGRLGRQVGHMFRRKSARRELYAVDVEIDWENLNEKMARPALAADPAEIAARAREVYGCDVLIFGVLEKPRPETEKVTKQHQGFTTTIRTDESTKLLLHVRAVDLDAPQRYAVVGRFELKNNFEISQTVDEVLKILTGAPTPKDIAAADPANRMVAVGPNLCPLGDFGMDIEKGLAALAGWSFPMRDDIALVGETGRGAVLHYAIPTAVAATTGLFCYSPYIPIEPETHYQVSFEAKTMKPSIILFVKAYRDMEVQGYEETTTLRQEVFKHQVRFYGKKGEWGRLTSKPFLPRSVKPDHMPTHLRVQLYAYHPAGEVFFDNVTVRRCILPEANEKAAESVKK